MARLVLWALVVLLGALNTWRAYTLSFTIDEAYSYLAFSSQSTAVLFESFHSNHHTLFSMLSKLAWKGLGVSEFSLRLPSVLAGFAFLALAAALACETFRDGRTALLAFASIALNPLVLDLLAAARGYSLALAFWTGALLLTVRSLRDSRIGLLCGAGACLGLAVAANLAFAFPSVALMLAAVQASGSGPKPRSFPTRLLAIGGPFVAAATAVLARSLVNFSAEHLYLGTDTLRGAFETILTLSIPGWENRYLHLWSAWLVEGLAWFAIAGSLVLGAASIRNRRWRAETLICGTFLATLILLVLANWIFRVKYPYTRTGVYLVILMLMAGAAAAQGLGNRRLLPVWWLAACLVTAVELTALRVDHFAEWIGDADNKAVAASLQRVLAEGDRLCVSWELEPGLNFYRERRKLPIPPIARNDLSGHCNVLVLLGDDQEIAVREGLEVLFRGKRSQAIVVRR